MFPGPMPTIRWITGYRRHARDYERRPDHAEPLIQREPFPSVPVWLLLFGWEGCMDEMTTRLHQAAQAGDGDRDRVCEEIAEALISANITPRWSISSGDFADPMLLCAGRYWRRRFLREPTVTVAAACAHWLREHADALVRPAIAEVWALGYAFITRDTEDPRDDLTRATGAIVEAYHGDADICYFAALYHAGKLRANFRYDELRRFLDSSLLAVAAGPHRDTPLITSLRAYAALGLGISDGLVLLDGVWTTPDRSRAVVDVCLHALDIASPRLQTATLLREHAETAVTTYPTDHAMWYRLARGRLKCGDAPAALEAITRALTLLPAIGARVSHTHLQERYIAERTLIEQQDRLASFTDAEPAHTSLDVVRLRREMYRTVLAGTIAAVVLMTALSLAVTLTMPDSPSLGDRVRAEALLGGGLLLTALLISAIARRVILHRLHDARDSTDNMT